MLKVLERPHTRPKHARPRPPARDTAGTQRKPLRGDVEGLTEAGNELIAEDLSGDSAAFLKASEQQRGE